MAKRISRLEFGSPEFDAQLDDLLTYNEQHQPQVQDVVRDIVEHVRRQGDSALLEYTNQFDRRNIDDATALEVSDLDTYRGRISDELREALESAATRVRSYHERQRIESWDYTESDGTVLGQQITALERIGVYVPGGKAAYPSSVLMNVIPAKVAGVTEVIMVVPAPDNQLDNSVLAAAAIAGVDKVFTVGGAQAVAALAYGTETIPAVDKIVGPGNIYVATAKSMVFGRVGIDMIAGPSEILVICDGKTNPDWIAMDLFSQAEHDEQAQAILISTDRAFISEVEASIERLLPTLSRIDIVTEALETRGALISVETVDQAIAISNRIAPEHLELSVEEPRRWLKDVKHAGAIFLGRYTAEALGDYCAGPNHVLPTSGTARFSSPLGVYDFQKRSSIIECSSTGASKLGQLAQILATGEGLDAHARSAGFRVRSD